MNTLHRVMTALGVWLIANIVIGLITVPGAAGRVPVAAWIILPFVVADLGVLFVGTWWVERGWERDKAKVYAKSRAWTPPTDPNDTRSQSELLAERDTLQKRISELERDLGIGGGRG